MRKSVPFLWLLLIGLTLFLLVRKEKAPPSKVNDSLRPVPEATTETPIELPPFEPAHAKMSEEFQEKSQILHEIFASKNDNDPRLDTEFSHLSSDTKRRFEALYQGLAPEQRNERGTLVYLLGKNLRTPQDLEFLRRVLDEPPCRSLGDCSREPEGGTHLHREAGAEVSLAYPQVVAIKSIEKFMNENREKELSAAARQMLDFASKSETPIVAQMAQDLLRIP